MPNTSFSGRKWNLGQIISLMFNSVAREVKYIGFYSLPGAKPERVSSLAATGKMDYICDAINQAGYSVHLISPSWIYEIDSTRWFHKQNTVKISEGKKLTYCPSFVTKNKITRNFKIIFTLAWLFFWLLKNTKKNEKILVYHVQWLSLPIRWAKKLKGFKLVLEVEEIYADVSLIHPYFKVLEEKLIASADAYLFSTELLAEKINHPQKPQITIYGAYKSYPFLFKPPEDGKIHLLYAGIIDSQKAGAFNAIEATTFLPENYVLHVIGFGELEKLVKRIAELNKINKCKIFFDGTKSGEDYLEYTQGCHIGLSTQKMDGKYLDSSFPSKILSYMSLGLEVVSCYVECVSKSKIGKLVSYYHRDTPQEIAKAIMSVNLKEKRVGVEAIRTLHEKFVLDIKKILASM